MTPLILSEKRIFAMADRLIEQAAGSMRVTFTGAEPVLHAYLYRLVDRLLSADNIRIVIRQDWQP